MNIPTPSELGISVPNAAFDATAGQAYDDLLFHSEEGFGYDEHGCPEWFIYFPELDFRLSIYSMTAERAAEKGIPAQTVLKLDTKDGQVQFCHRDCLNEATDMSWDTGFCHYALIGGQAQRHAFMLAMEAMVKFMQAHPEWF